MLKQICAISMAIFTFAACSNKSHQADNRMNEEEMTSDNKMYMLVGTYTASESKGIYVYRLDTVTGTSEYISVAKVDNPSYLTFDGSEKYVYAVSEEDVETAAVSAFSFDKKEGKLTLINKQPTEGGAPCYITTDESGKHVVVANYSGASVTAFGTNEDGSLKADKQIIRFTGKGLDKERQMQPYLHCVRYSPDGKYILADDLGTDMIHKLVVTANATDTNYLTIGIPDAFFVKPGSGPRHLEFHPNGKYAYLITELSGDVIAFDYKDGNLSEIQTIKADTLNAKGSADIHISPDGNYLYASNRLKGDGIAIFSINQTDGKLTKVGYQSTGIHPRNFAITPNGKLLLVANRDSDQIQVFRRDMNTGLLENTGHNITLDMPVCIKFASIN